MSQKYSDSIFSPFLGTIENITYSNIHFHSNNTKSGFMSPMYITLNYDNSHKGPTNVTATPIFRNINVTNFYSNNSYYGWHLDGLNDSLIQNVYFSNIRMDGTPNDNLIKMCDNINGFCDNSTVSPYCPPCIEEICLDTSSDCTQYLGFCNNPAYRKRIFESIES